MAKTKKSERFDAIYARQSVDKRDSVSIEAQIDDCKVKCSGKIRVYKDKGYSGKNIERPDLQRLMVWFRHPRTRKRSDPSPKR